MFHSHKVNQVHRTHAYLIHHTSPRHNGRVLRLTKTAAAKQDSPHSGHKRPHFPSATQLGTHDKHPCHHVQIMAYNITRSPNNVIQYTNDNTTSLNGYVYHA